MEKRICKRDGCGKEFKAHPFSLKKYCSQKCRQILWALRESQKAIPQKKSKILATILILTCFSIGQVFGYEGRTSNASLFCRGLSVEKLADAIFLAEHSTNHPYGILAPYCTADSSKKCRKGCVQTIQKRLGLWNGQGDFIAYLSRSYAPMGVANDPHGLNRFWVSNVKYFFERTRT